MKQITVESLRIVESLLFWSAALPAALIVIPLTILADKAKNLLHRTAIEGPPKTLTPRMA